MRIDCFTSRNNLINCLGNPKDRVDNEENSGIYKISCGELSVSSVADYTNLRASFEENISSSQMSM